MKFVKIFLLFAFILSLVSCGEDRLISKWTEKKIEIDGNLNEWTGSLVYDKDSQTAIGVQNDKDYLYVCLTTKNKDKALPILMRGFTVWFEPEEGKTIGIKYPLPSDMVEIMPNRKMEQNSQDQVPRFDFKEFESKHPEFQVINEDEYPLHQFYIDDTAKYSVRLSYNNNQLVYELRIPIGITESNLNSLESNLGEKVLISFETSELNKPEGRRNNEMGSRTRGGMGMGSKGSQSGDRSGRGGPKGHGAERPSKGDPLDYEIEAQLAVEK